MLDSVRVANLRCVRVATGTAQGATLPEQTPRLVEPDLDRFQAPVLVR